MKKAEELVDVAWVSKGDSLWIQLPDSDLASESYRRATAVDIKPETEKVLIRFEGASADEEVNGKLVFAVNNYSRLPDGYDDMVEMENLSEAELLYNLRERYTKGKIFTYVGSSLIVLNPYCMIPELFTTEILSKFQTSVRELKFDPKSHIPHVYAISSGAVTNLLRDQRNQAIVISGESGAGKTENTKFAMKFLTSLNSAKGEAVNSDEPSIEDKILACNPILEAFGNAKTVRNDNSSRFGKYVSLLISKGSSEGKIMGATITNYLLEKSRCCTQSQGERNYHIYYHLFKGATQKELEALKLFKDGKSRMESCFYLNRSGCYEVQALDDVELYNEVVASFNTMKFTQEEQKAIWTIVACSLLLGNVDFDDSALTDKIPCIVKNEEYLKDASNLLQIDYEELNTALMFKFREIQGQVIQSTISKAECITQRDSLAKELYNTLFNWLVKRLNFTVMPAEFLKDGADIPQLLHNYFHIGLLDIFGFEIFKVNSIEQLCINYTNEQLQQLYIFYIFKAEEKEFCEEGLQDYLCEIVFKDNQDVIELLDKPPAGIFCLTDESCSVNSTDEALCQKIIKSHEKNPCFKKPKMAKDTFIVMHTASPVEYNINGFRFKNRDELSAYIEKALFKSSFKEIPRIYKGLCGNEAEPEVQAKKGTSAKDKFLGAKFRMQMKDLYNELKSCDCHFIRCIKPNNRKEKKLFMPRMTLEQIQYMGLLETIKVRKLSYPTRRYYKNFYEKYEELAGQHSITPFHKHVELGSDFKSMSKDLVKYTKIDFGSGILFGNTKVFMKLGAEAELNKILYEKMKGKMKAAKVVQKFWRKYCLFVKKWYPVRKKVLACLKGIRVVQNLFRVRAYARKLQQTKKLIRKIQRWYLTILQTRKFQKIKTTIKKLQTWWKMNFYWQKYKKIYKDMIRIQKVFRGFLVRKKYKIIRFVQTIVEQIISNGTEILLEKIQGQAAIKIQARVRGIIARRINHMIIQKAKLVGLNIKLLKYALMFQRNIRGFLVRSKLKRWHKAARVIQGAVRMKWLRETFLEIRWATPIIQRKIRCWLAWSTQAKRRLEGYKAVNETYLDDVLAAEVGTLFGGIGYYKEQMELGKIAMDVNQFEEEYGAKNRSKVLPTLGNKKVALYARIIDLDTHTDLRDIYEPLWSEQALDIQNQFCKNPEYDIQVYEAGGYHTLAMTNHPKLYSWGANDKFQLGRPLNLKQFKYTAEEVSLEEIGGPELRPRILKAGDDHNLLLDSQGKLYAWGANNKGQLGLGHTKDIGEIVQVDLGVSGDPVIDIRAKGANSVAVTASGGAFTWPILLESGWKLSPYRLDLPKNVKISSASCGMNFTVLLASNGLLFSFGTDNSAGQLGLGDTQPRRYPTLISKLKNDGELAAQVSCGFKHVICKTTFGKIFVWGWGSFGQLGLKGYESRSLPVLCESRLGAYKEKILQVQAGYRCSIALTENRRLYWTGTNGTLDGLNTFREVNLADKIPGWSNNIDLQPTRVLCTWSKALSLIYVTLADTKTVEMTKIMKGKFASTITTKLEEIGGLDDITPPYVESLSKYFPSAIMKKPKVITPADKKKQLDKSKLSTDLNASLRSDLNVTSKRLSKDKHKGLPLISSKGQITHQSLEEDDEESHPGGGFSNDSFMKVTNELYDLTTEISREEAATASLPKRSNVEVLREAETQRGRLQIDKSRLSPSKGSKALPTQSSMTSSYIPKTPERLKINALYEKRPKKSPIRTETLDWKVKLKMLREKLEMLLLTPKNRWTLEDKQFMKIASEPEMFFLLKSAK
mgnify:FL=1